MCHSIGILLFFSNNAVSSITFVHGNRVDQSTSATNTAIIDSMIRDIRELYFCKLGRLESFIFGVAKK